MDFDRFTRSMLLAQGGFAAFLEAPPDGRAPILEQITGTAVYSRISMRVHEQRLEKNKELDRLKAGLEGLQPLSAEDELQLATSLEEKTGADEELMQQAAGKNLAISWLEGIARLEEEQKQIGLGKIELQARLEAFAPEQERLENANRALELDGVYGTLTSIRNEQEADRRSLEERRKSLPASEQTAKQAQEAMTIAAKNLEANKLEQRKAAPVIRKVRDLDSRIAEKAAPIKTATDSVAKCEKSLKALATEHKKDCAALDAGRKALGELALELDATRADEGLVEHLAGIRERFEALQNLHGQLGDKLDGVVQAEAQLREGARLWHEQLSTLESAGRKQDGALGLLTEKQAEQGQVLEGKDLGDWRDSLSLLAAQKEVLGSAMQATGALLKSEQALEELRHRKATLNNEQANLQGQLEGQKGKQAALGKEVELLEDQLVLLKKIEDLKEHRRQLQDGQACPLCGSEEHPFAKGNVPVPGETSQRLTTARGDLKSATEAVSDLKVKLAQTGKDLEQAASGEKEHAGKIEEARCAIAQTCTGLPLDAGDADLEAKLTALQDDNGKAWHNAANTMKRGEEIEKDLAILRKALESAKESVAQADRDVQAASHRKDTAGQALERLMEEADGLKGQLDKSLGGVHQDVQHFGVDTLTMDRLDTVREHLTTRRDLWVANQKEKADLEQKIAALEMQTGHQKEQIQESEIELERQRELLAGLRQEEDALGRQREDMFADRDPDKEEERLSKAVERADKELEAARHKVSKADQVLGQLKSAIAELVKAIEVRDARLESSRAAFQVRLEKSGFADEEGYLAACLQEVERKALAQLSHKLADENTELASRKRNCENLLEAERQKRITDEPAEDLKGALLALIADQKELQQEIGGIRQKLENNSNLKHKQQEQVKAIEAQRHECSRWDLLHELIGSADGKKYRNFAQGLTFEMMVGHANRQLQKMTDRYLLIREKDQPLELCVIDNYQAGEVRSTKNLSGGESFIVSLSLALGLSNMASRNVRVDSLFLDEGFGTLDEETLETALETLAGLHQDGKLIGVISHVPALKERIATQIQVEPQTGGRSRISGPGCVGKE